jgi:site-specific recombinase XerD
MGKLLTFPEPNEFDGSTGRRRDRIGEPTLREHAETWQLYLDNVCTPKTISAYRAAVEGLASYMEGTGLRPVLTEATWEVVVKFLDEVQARTSASTADTRRRGLVQFFGWIVKEEGLLRPDENPMNHVRPRKIVEKVVQPIPEEVIHALLADASDKTSFLDVQTARSSVCFWLRARGYRRSWASPWTM